MKKIIFIIIYLFPSFLYSQFNEKKRYNIEKTNEPPKIDGYLNEMMWTNLDLAKEFTQVNPNNGKEERNKQRTEVKICYDNKNIYFGVMMYDNAPDSILRELSKRDDYNKNNDKFELVIDPFNNTQVEYAFAITAAGVQIDMKKSKTGTDENWNAVWESAVNINEKGWSAEISIPFSQLRFPDNNEPWALNMSRIIRRYREIYSWNPININFQNYSLQSGLLEGIKDIKSPIRLSFMPYASIYADSYDGETVFPYNYGMDLKYGINESFTLDMTLIPDFGQVASDAMVLNLSPFEVKYEEKRQFFNEGVELFNKGGELFYSRRLENDLINATKITGRTKNGFGIAALNAITNKTNNKPLTNYNVFIVDKALENSSSVSLMNTNVINTDNNKNANVTGIFTRLNNKNNTHVLASNIKISKEIYTDSSNTGLSGMLSIAKNSGNYRYELYSNFEDQKYNPNDLGFLYANNEINTGIHLGYEQLKENKHFVFSKYYLFLRHNTLFTEQKFVDFEIEAESKFMLKNYLFLMLKIVGNPYEKYDYYESRTEDFNNPLKRSRSIRVGAYLSSDFRNKFAIDLGGGTTIQPLYSGNEYKWRISPRYRFNDKTSMIYVLSVRNRYNDIGFIANDTSSLLLEPPIVEYIFAKRNTYMITNVLSFNYILNNKIDLAVKLRYHLDQVENKDFLKLEDDGYLYESNYTGNHNINYTTWTSDIALNWWFAPGSQISIVWKNGIDNLEDELTYHWINNIQNSFNISQQNSLSLKIVYYLDYLYLIK